MKKIILLFCASFLLLIFLTNPLSAQPWLVNINGDLETTNVGAPGYVTTAVSLSYANVLINTGLGINLGVGSTLALPIAPGSATTTVYPLAVQGTTVLWDPADGIRNIIGLSATGGIGIWTGSDGSNGSGIQLFSKSSAFFPGSASLISNGAPGSQVAFANVNYNPTTSLVNPLFLITTNGNARLGNNDVLPTLTLLPTATDRLTVDGNIYINSTDNTDVDRNMYAKSTVAALNVSSGAQTDGSDGACFNAYAYNVTPATTRFPGAFIVKSNLYQKGDLGFGYINHVGLTSGTIYDHNIFLASKQGVGCFGKDMNLTDIVHDDVFTIKLSLGFYSAVDKDPRNIHGETNAGDLSISSYTDYKTGSNIDLFGTSHATKPGQIVFTSGNIATGGLSLMQPSMVFTNYDGAAQTNNFTITADGHAIFGHGLGISDIPHAEIFTVDNSFGFYSAADADLRTIYGNSYAGALTLNATLDNTNGSAINLYGKSNSTNPGQLVFSSYGGSGPSVFFDNYDGSAHHNVSITNSGEMTVGHDLDPSSIVSGDVLTVQNQIGFYSHPDADYARAIHGNSSIGGLTMYSTTGWADGSGIELWAPNSDHPGEVHFITSSLGSDTGPAYQFLNHSPTYQNYMQINKDGRVIIGGPGTSVDDLTAPGDYGLYVGHGILTEHIHVALNSTVYWADYVFNNNYKLMPINNVAEYVRINKHLPDVPSAEEVVENGIDLASMDAKLLKKIEELTLYVIQQQKQIDELKEEIKNRK